MNGWYVTGGAVAGAGVVGLVLLAGPPAFLSFDTWSQATAEETTQAQAVYYKTTADALAGMAWAGAVLSGAVVLAGVGLMGLGALSE
jgi:hypothetical protein